jgi:hypothetical protein
MWELFCTEHDIGQDGEMIENSKYANQTEENQSFRSFFAERREHVYTPRALYVDLAPQSILFLLFSSIHFIS